jgi:hypothetical protein
MAPEQGDRDPRELPGPPSGFTLGAAFRDAGRRGLRTAPQAPPAGPIPAKARPSRRLGFKSLPSAEHPSNGAKEEGLRETTGKCQDRLRFPCVGVQAVECDRFPSQNQPTQ